MSPSSVVYASTLHLYFSSLVVQQSKNYMIGPVV